MRLILVILATILLTNVNIAQPTDKKISRITFEMVDGNYERAIKRAEKLTSDFEYRKNAWLYFYLTQSYFEVAKRPELADEYPRAFRSSLKAAYRLYRYRDASAENERVYEEAEQVLTKLKDSTITLSEIYYDNENPRKASYYLKQLIKFDPDDYAAQLMLGVYEIKSRNVGAGIKNIMTAIDSMDQNYIPDDVSAQTLVDALEEYALIIKSGEYDRYFSAYKFNPTQADVDKALAMKEEYRKYIIGPEEDKAARKKDSEVIYKSFKSEDKELDEEEENDEE